MGVIAIVLLACSLLVLLGAEWPRIAPHVGGEAWSARSRRRRKQRLTVIEGEEGEEANDDFAKSVERDLANLPVIGERDDRTRR